MRHEKTIGIVLGRINFGEADRILTIITPEHGKLRLIAKGVRKEKSKLAGGIELFSTSNISFIPGKKEISTLVSTRLIKHYSHIASDMDRTLLGYEILKHIDKHTQEQCDKEYFELLNSALVALNNTETALLIIKTWFTMRLLNLLGRAPNLKSDGKGDKLVSGQKYQFDYDSMCFVPSAQGSFHEKHIKFIRLLSVKSPTNLQTISGVEKLAKDASLLLQNLLEYSV